MTGNEAAAEASIRAGCRYYYGYPITPQNEFTMYMSARMPEVGGTFLQAESELAAISMVHGSAAAGARAMTSSSSPGISLKQEGISYLAGSELPAVVVNVQRGGPGLGDIRPSQGDYFQATRGGGHGDYRIIVLAPHTVQEFADLMSEAFELADRYRIPVMALADAQLGQMMEPVVFRPFVDLASLPPKPWALSGAKGRPRNIVDSFFPAPGEIAEFNHYLIKKHARIQAKEASAEVLHVDDAKLVLVAYGSPARVAREVVKRARKQGQPVGLIRPITLWPFPSDLVRAAAERADAMLVVEMSTGQLVEDVRLAVEGRCEVHLHPFPAEVPMTKQVLARARRLLKRLHSRGTKR